MLNLSVPLSVKLKGKTVMQTISTNKVMRALMRLRVGK